jgi:hypothetical protein
MNLADLSTLLTFFAGAITAPIYAVSTSVPWWVLVLTTIWGVLIGLAAAFGADKVAYWLLMDKSENRVVSGLKFAGYILWPIPAIVLSALVSYSTTNLFLN